MAMRIWSCTYACCAQASGSCYYGPGFPIEVHDVGTNTVVDNLPPAPATTDADVNGVGQDP